MKKLDKLIDSYENEIVEKIQRLVKIKSVREKPVGEMPFGQGVQKALEEALKISEEMGFETKNIDNYVGEATYGTGDKEIALIAHLDVVPEGNGWTNPPYSATYKDGVIYGRGVSDNKGPAIMALFAVKALIDSGEPINKKLKVLFGTNEESGMEDLKYYAKNVKTPDLSLVPDASFPVVKGEKGIMTFKFQTIFKQKLLTEDIRVVSGSAGNAVNSVPDYAELTLEADDLSLIRNIVENFNNNNDDTIETEIDGNKIKLVARGVSAHGSRPETGRNAMSILFDSLKPIIETSNQNIAKFIKFYNDKIAFNHHGENVGCGFEDEQSGKLAFNPGLMSIVENAIEVSVNIRFPITYTAHQIYDGMRGEIIDIPVTLIEGSDSEPYYYPDDHPVIKGLMDVYKDYTNDNESEPLVLGGGTYSRVIENSITFGPGFSWSQSNAHKPDEQAKVEDILLATKIYAAALYRLTR
ncbi:MAG: dipeptidase PepV [Clostridia bacterium]